MTSKNKPFCFIRRRKLGYASVEGVVNAMRTPARWVRNDMRKTRQPNSDEITIRWGCTSNVASRNVVNKASAIHEVSDKANFRELLNHHELCTTTWFDVLDVPHEILKNQGVIVRPARHAGGRRLWHCTNLRQLMQATRRAGPGYYINEYIKKTAEYRVYIVQGRVVAVAIKNPEDVNAVAWNHAQGSHFENVRWGDWPLKAVRVSLEAFELTELDFGGVDIMVDEEGEAYVLEINSAPSLPTPYRQGCFAKAFDYIYYNGKDRIPRIEEKGGWKKFIHPAISDKAIMVEVNEESTD